MTDVAGDVGRELRSFIEENYLYLHPDVELGEDDDLLGLGILDSLAFIELVEEIQSRYGIAVQDIEITEENFGSLRAMTRFVESRRAS
ncbi:MAG: acyl carrier protein [Thermoleophilaceae bacterium]|nr:acyl carrier protein [Thermoleophilaceae bacterium]